jgi:electron transfer flavoprotein beta subunit
LGYDSIVCVKQVPDTANITGEAMKADGTVNRAALPAIFNPDDLHALETAMEVRDRFGGSVTAITMGPPAACEILRECLYRGADRVILVSDRRAAASDTLATSYILNQVVRKIARFDMVFCGRLATSVSPRSLRRIRSSRHWSAGRTAACRTTPGRG